MSAAELSALSDEQLLAHFLASDPADPLTRELARRLEDRDEALDEAGIAHQ